MSFLSQAQALLSDVEELPSVVDLRSALCDSAVSVWTRHCPTQTALDELLWSLFKQRYGDQDKIASTTVTTSSISGSSESARLASVIDGLFSSVKVGLPVWGPFLSGLIRVSKAPGANPVIRKQCYKFVFEWLRGSLQAHSAALFGPASGRLVTLAVGEVEPLPLCSCHGFPVSDSTVPCFVHGGGDREETLQCEWAPVHFDWVLCLISSGLTDVWSAIRKDVSTRLFGMIDLLPLPYVHRVVGTLVRIAALKDKRETLWREQEGALLGIAIVLKRFRRAGAREDDHLGRSKTPTADKHAAFDGVIALHWAGRGMDITGQASPSSLPPPESIAVSPTDTSRSRRWNRPVRSDADQRSMSGTPRHRSLGRASTPTSSRPRTQASPRMASPRASRILGAIAAHPSSSSAGVDGGLWFGGKLLPGLPLPLGAPVRSIALPKLAHSQLSVRENAIRLYATYLSRSPVSEVVSCLDDILDILALKVSLVDYGPKLESTEEEGSARVPLNGLLPAFSAEGVLGLLAIVVRLVGPAALHAEWAVIFQSVFKYLGHPASTVRQITSKVFLEVMISTKVDQSEVAVSLLSSVVLDLVSSWSAAPIDALVAFPSGPSHPSLSWECKEGLLLTYELMLNFVLAAHRRKLHPYASLTAVKARVSVTSVPAKRETSRPTSPASSTPVRPAASEDKPTTSTILSPIMSPWLSSPGPDAAVAITPMPKPPVPALVLPNLRSDSPVRRSLQPPSFLDKLRVAVAAAGRETIWWRIVTQLVDAVSDGGFELRRMADQVLPLLTEALVWADLPSLHRLWACMTPCASSHLTPACLVIGRTISLIIRRLKRLHLNLIALGVSGSTGVDITTGRPAGSPLQCPTCAFPILTSDTLVTADTQWLCHCPAGRVQRVSTQVRHLVNLHLHDMLSLCLGAPSDAVLVLMCETLLLVREHLASFPDSLPQDNVPVDGSVGEEDVVAPPSAPLPRLLSVVLNRVFQVISIFDRSGLPESVSSSLTPPVRVSLTRSPAVSTVRTVADVGTEPFESPLLSPVYSRRYLSALKVSGCFTPDSSSGLSSPALSDVSADVTQSPRAIRNNRAQLLDRSLSSSLSPLFPQLLPLLTANEKLCLLPLVVYWGLRHSDAPTRAMNMDISSTCLSDILSSAEVRSVCNTKCVQALSGGSVVWGSTISSASPSKVVRPRPSPLSVSNSPDAVIPDNVHPFAREVLVAVSNTTSSLVSALSNPALDVASLRLCLAPLKVILLQSLLFPVFEEVLTAFAGRFRNAMSVGGDSSSRWARVGASSSQVDLRLDRFGLDEPSGRSAPSTPNFSTHALSATFEQIPGLLLKPGGPDGVSLAGAGEEDVKGGAVPSPLPIPDPKLWRGPMLDTAAARVTRTSGRLMGLSLDFSSDGMTPLLDGGESPQLQPQSGRSSARKSKPRDPSDMVDVAVDAITLSVDVDGAVGSRPPSEGNPFASVPGEGAGWVRGSPSVASESKEEGDGDEGCEWDDWDAESDQDKPVESTAQTSSSLDDPAVAEVSAFLKELRASCVAAAACLGLPEGDNPFQHVLAKLLSPSDAFVIHWLLRHENVM